MAKLHERVLVVYEKLREQEHVLTEVMSKYSGRRAEIRNALDAAFERREWYREQGRMQEELRTLLERRDEQQRRNAHLMKVQKEIIRGNKLGYEAVMKMIDEATEHLRWVKDVARKLSLAFDE
ncbi:unnamed protein product [Nippostrongylus brasiliensis]|uniref:Uncharacterized protein n=1 Tax=Nippostrongylus brasiliensis TaxID=27835 RepID=A0A0N4YN24_NIPBR|nr:unnamed protein product [Nippostrongylus brasiliensis]